MDLPLPTENYGGYQKSSILERSEWINGKEFFLAHGMADRNVHFQHSMILAKKLVSQNVPFEQHVSSVLRLLKYRFFVRLNYRNWTHF